VSVSAASFFIGPVAPESIVSAFGIDLGVGSASAPGLPLPTELAGTTATITDSSGAEFAISLLFVSGGQVNFLVPPNLATGRAVITIRSGDGATVQEAEVEIAPVARGVFSLNSQRITAALILRVAPGGEQTIEQVVELDGGVLKAVPIDFGPEGHRLFLLLFGTGIRGSNRVDLRIDGRFVSVSFFGPQGDFVGLDQANAELTRDLAGRGLVNVELIADRISANVTKLMFR